MKHCPNVGCAHVHRHGGVSEFLDKVDRCSDCGARLVAGEAPAPEPSVFREWVTVYESDTGVQAHLIKAALENDDIPVHISGESLLGAVGELPAVMLVKVQVPPECADRARLLALECERADAAEAE